MFFESLAFAFGAPPGGSGGSTEMFAQFVPLVLMIAVFWFLLIRPQKKRQQEHKSMLESLRRGDVIITTGGIIGRIVDVDGDVLIVDLGETKARVGRGFVSGMFDARALPAQKEKKSKAEPKEEKARTNAEKTESAGEASEERKEDRKEERKEEKE